MLVLGYFMDDVPNKLLKGIVFNGHKLIGLTILCLVILRFFWMLINPKPYLEATRLERLAERTVHWALYIALFAMPLAGWIGSVAGGRPPRWGSLVFNLPIKPGEYVADIAFTLHNKLAIIFIVLISLHVLAALFHHFVKKDHVLQRMLP